MLLLTSSLSKPPRHPDLVEVSLRGPLLSHVSITVVSLMMILLFSLRSPPSPPSPPPLLLLLLLLPNKSSDSITFWPRKSLFLSLRSFPTLSESVLMFSNSDSLHSPVSPVCRKAGPLGFLLNHSAALRTMIQCRILCSVIVPACSSWDFPPQTSAAPAPIRACPRCTLQGSFRSCHQ